MSTIINPLLGTTKIITPTNEGLVGYWSFNESGSIAKDYSGNNKHGFLIGATTRVDGINGGALRFSTSRVRISNTTTLQLSRSFTFSCWFKSTGTSGGVYPCVFSTGKNDGSGWLIGYFSNTHRFGITRPSLSSILYQSDSCLDNIWYHGVVTVGSGVTAPVSIYINGKLSISSSTNQGLATNTQDQSIGADLNGGAGFWLGLIDEVRIYNRVLSAGEISTLYKSGISKIII